MASFRICCGGYFSQHISHCRNSRTRRSTVAVARPAVEIHNPHVLETRTKVEKKHRRLISRETIEAWVRESATEIVKNLANAPLLIQVIEEADGRKRRLEVEKGASAEMWMRKKRHEVVGEGVIVVEELKDGRDSRGVYWNGEMSGEESSKAWGMIVQGRGLECGPVCYLIKTSRVGSSVCGCTHFCLVSVNGFDQTAERQLTDVWLS